MFRSFARLLTFLFLFAFTAEVCSGATLEHSSVKSSHQISDNTSGGFLSNFLFEEWNESEEEKQDVKSAILTFDTAANNQFLIGGNLTIFVRQYLFDLAYSLGLKLKYLFNSSWLI